METERVAILESLNTTGFAEVDGVHSIEEAQELTRHLGALRPLNGQCIQMLSPTTSDQARFKSFSKNFGYGRFPLHTDTAFWKIPARYLICYMPDVSTVDTVVLPAAETFELVRRSRGENPVFSRAMVSGTCYSAPWFGRNSVVFDPCYMRPVNRAALRFCEQAEELFAGSQRISWSGSKMVVIDNWYALHGRQPAEGQGRSLFRFYRGGEE